MALENTIQSPNQVQSGSETSLFFNVMPKGKHDQMVQPEPIHKVQPTQPIATVGLPITQSASAIAIPPHKKSKLVLILTPLIIILLAAAGYGVWVMQKAKNDTSQAPIGDDVKDEEETKTPEETTAPLSNAPKEWLLQYFGSESCTQENICGDKSDPERDGLINSEEYQSNTDPNNADSDKDGLADGDEVRIFASSPTKPFTAEDVKYNDADYARGGYDTSTKEAYSESRLAEVKTAMRSHGLHQPTLTTLGDTLFDVYGFTESETDPTPKPQGTQAPAGFENTPEAKLDRDSQRLETIKKLGTALVKLKAQAGSYPETSEFAVVLEKIKPFITTATNTKDPINKAPYLYGYLPGSKGSSFTLTYYSETQNQLIKYRSTDAEREVASASSSQTDEQRIADLEAIQTALLIYSSSKVTPASITSYIFPSANTYKTELSPNFITSIPKDPKTGKDYEYKVSEQFNSFTIKAVLESPEAGTTGFLCNQEECREY